MRLTRLPIVEMRMRIAWPRRRGASTLRRGVNHAHLYINAIRTVERTAVVIECDIITVAHLTMARES